MMTILTWLIRFETLNFRRLFSERPFNPKLPGFSSARVFRFALLSSLSFLINNTTLIKNHIQGWVVFGDLVNWIAAFFGRENPFSAVINELSRKTIDISGRHIIKWYGSRIQEIPKILQDREIFHINAFKVPFPIPVPSTNQAQRMIAMCKSFWQLK